MNKNGFFMAILGMMMVLMMAACPSPDKDDDKKNDKQDIVWPNTSGYTSIISCREGNLSDARKNPYSVSPGKYYFDGRFSSFYGSSDYYGITSDQDCKITIDFIKFRFGSLRNEKGDNVVHYVGTSDVIDIVTNTILVLRANPGNLFSTNSRDYMVGFSVTAAE
jgi:hypothetical protein